MNKHCQNCESARKRSAFDIKKYGNYQCPYECLQVIDRVEYKKADDTCPLWKERRINKGDKHIWQKETVKILGR